jgi:hypothetical protein
MGRAPEGFENPGLAKPSGGGRRWLECEVSPTQPGNNSIRHVPRSLVTGNYLKNNSTESWCVERSGRAPYRNRMTAHRPHCGAGCATQEVGYYCGQRETPRSRVTVAPRSFLDAGTEVLPGDRKFLDYAFPPLHTPTDVATNTGGRVGWHRSPLPGPLFPGPGPW